MIKCIHAPLFNNYYYLGVEEVYETMHMVKRRQLGLFKMGLAEYVILYEKEINVYVELQPLVYRERHLV